MKSCVEKMATEQQELIRERYFAERSVKEIAGILDRSAARVSMTLTRIRRALMKCMEQRLEGAGR